MASGVAVTRSEKLLLMNWLNWNCELKESEIRPPEIPSTEGSVFLADMRSHKSVFCRLELRGPGADSPEGVKRDVCGRVNDTSPKCLRRSSKVSRLWTKSQ